MTKYHVGVGILGKEPAEQGGAVRLGAAGAERAEQSDAGDAQGRAEHAGTNADVLGIALFDMTRSRQSRARLALNDLDARLLIDRDGLKTGFGTLGRQAIDLAHVVTVHC